MTILITGGAGYIGSHFAMLLEDNSVPFIILDDLSNSTRGLLPDGWRIVDGSVADRAALNKAFGLADISSVVHFAGSTSVSESVFNPLKYYRNNFINSIFLLEYTVQMGVRNMIFSSTAAVYGARSSKRLTENSITNPESPYGWSKLMFEQVLKDFAKTRDLNVGILRYFNVAGADPRGRLGQSTPNATHLIKVACEAAAGSRDSFSLYGADYPTPDGTCIRDFIHVTDLADAHLCVLQHMEKETGFNIVNCGYGRGFSVLQVIDQVKRESGVDFAVDIVDRRDGDLVEVVADSSKLRAEYAWTPKYDSLELIIKHALDWERR